MKVEKKKKSTIVKVRGTIRVKKIKTETIRRWSRNTKDHYYIEIVQRVTNNYSPTIWESKDDDKILN